MATVNITVKQYDNPPLYNAVQLSYNITDDVCDNPKTTYQIDNSELNISSKIYDMSNIFGVSGWYSDGINKVEWDGNTVISIESCTIPPIYFFKFSNTGKATSSEACLQNIFGLTFYAYSNVLSIGLQLFSDPEATIPATTGNLFYKEESTLLPYRINASILEEIGECSQTGFPFAISSQSGNNSLTEACGYTDRLLTAYGELPAIFAGSVLYRDEEMTIPFGESSSTRFHAITVGSTQRSIELGIDGTILSIQNCS